MSAGYHFQYHIYNCNGLQWQFQQSDIRLHGEYWHLNTPSVNESIVARYLLNYYSNINNTFININYTILCYILRNMHNIICCRTTINHIVLILSFDFHRSESTSTEIDKVFYDKMILHVCNAQYIAVCHKHCIIIYP